MSLQTADGYRLHTVHWLPDRETKAVVMLVHGIAEHSGRYGHVAQYLNTHGYAVHSYDHVGHGQSEGRRVYFDDLEQPVRHLAQFVDHVRDDHPNDKLFLYGHSMGALISLLYALEHQAALSGLIVSGIPLNLDEKAAEMLILLNGWLDKLVPWLPLIPFSSDGLSRDPSVVASYDNDPLVYRGLVRVRMSHFLIQRSRYARTQMRHITLPILILHGGSDTICPASGSQTLYDGVQSADKTLKLMPQMYHEIHNEPEHAEILTDVAEWLDARS